MPKGADSYHSRGLNMLHVLEILAAMALFQLKSKQL